MNNFDTVREALEAMSDGKYPETMKVALTALTELEKQEPGMVWRETERGADYIKFEGVFTEQPAAPAAQQPQARTDFTDEWTGYLKDGETPFERFLRERKDLDALTKLYQRALEENERLKAQPPQAEPTKCDYPACEKACGDAAGYCHKQPQAEAVPPTQGAKDVLAERQRQISAEGWTP